jgi:hypothetical protein
LYLVHEEKQMVSHDTDHKESEWCSSMTWLEELSVLISRHSHLGITHSDVNGMSIAEMWGLYRRLLRESGNSER